MSNVNHSFGLSSRLILQILIEVELLSTLGLLKLRNLGFFTVIIVELNLPLIKWNSMNLGATFSLGLLPKNVPLTNIVQS